MTDLIFTKAKMSSLEIAKLTGKRHGDLMRNIRKMEDAWVENDQRNFALVNYTDKKGETRPMYELTKTDCLYIATKFNDSARAKVILRWEELEQREASGLPNFSNPAEAARAWAEQFEKTQLQEHQLKIAAHKVKYADEVLSSDDTYNINQIAKELGKSGRKLNMELHQLGVQYKQGGTWLLYHKYQNKGYTKTKTHVYTGTNGETKTSMQTVWTEKGRKFIHELMQ